jgi:nitrogen-specific signal transduction histidine kinase
MPSPDVQSQAPRTPSNDDSSRQLDAAERVANGLLHEIRNILNPIVSAAYLLNANASDPAKVRDLAARIEGFAKAEARVLVKKAELLARESELLQHRSSETPSETSST